MQATLVTLTITLPLHYRCITVTLPLHCRYIAVTLPLQATLRTLTLQDNPIGDSGVVVFATMLGDGGALKLA